MKYLIKTTYPCVVKTQQDFFEMDINDTLECEAEPFLYVYPQNASQLPFCINVTKREDCEAYSFLSYNGQHIIFLEKPQNILFQRKEFLNFAGAKCEIVIGESSICFETENSKISCKCEHSCKDYRLFKLKNFACLLFPQDFYAFSVQKEKLYHFSGEELSFEENVLSITKKFHDCLNHEKTYKVKFDEDISVTDQIFTSRENTFQELLCLSFLDSVKVCDYASAKNFLAPTLQNKIDKDKMEQFFGKINQTIPINEKEFILTTTFGKKYVVFDTKDGQICDISLDNL